MKPQMNLARHSRNQKNKSPRTHLSQVRSPAFRLPWVHSRLASIAEGSKPLTREEREILRTHALAYIGLLRAHIQKEDNVLYPVAARVIPSSEMEKVAERFDDFEAREAPGRHDTLHTLAERLVETFPPDPSRTASP